jgi:USP6 N-terminal-like protein
VPETPQRTSRQKVISSPDSKHSQVSVTPSEGEDPDAFHVRSTYALLDSRGVKGDGVAEGVERTRARVGGSRASELQAENALADYTEKTRDLTDDEVQLLASLDRCAQPNAYTIDLHVLIPP